MTLPTQERIRGQVESAESYHDGRFILVSTGEDKMVGIWKSIRKVYGPDGAQKREWRKLHGLGSTI